MNSPQRQQLIERQKRRLEILQMLEEALDNDPSFIADLQGFMGVNRAPRQSGIKRVRLHTNYDKVRAYFAEIGNTWKAIAEIAQYSQVSVPSVRDMLYKRHKSEFAKRAHPSHGLKKQFRLKDPQLQGDTAP